MNNFIERYFAGDLDAIEHRELEDHLASSSELRSQFDEEYDRRTQTLGPLAFAPTNPDLAECFSHATLERYVRGQLGDQDRELIEDHTPCPWCAQQIRALRAQRSAQRLSLLRNNRGPAIAMAAAVLAIVAFLLPWRRPHFRTGPELGLIVNIRAPKNWVISGPDAVQVTIDPMPRLTLESRSKAPLYVGVLFDGRWSQPPVAKTNIPPNLIELTPGTPLQFPPPDATGTLEISVVISTLQQNTSMISAALPKRPEPGEWTLSVDGRPLMIHVRIERPSK